MKEASALAIVIGLSGCAIRGAPSFVLFGAYFPGWMFCALFGIMAAIAARTLMVATGLSETVPLQLFVCVSVGLIIAIGVWLLWFDS